MHAVRAAELDLSGLHCPWTVLHCKAALQRLQPGAELTITTDNMDATRGIHLFIQRGDAQFLAVHCDERGCHVQVRVADRRGWVRLRPSLPRLAAAGRLLRRWLGGPGGMPAVD